MALSDVVRLDHFRGLRACYEIPFGAQDATLGSWTEVPGQALVDAVRERLGTLPLVAEDLGFMDEGVRRLRDDNQLMGMVVLQLAFDGDPKNEHLPHHHERARIVYTGTHDNDTCAGWWAGASGPSQRQLRQVLRSSSRPTAVVRAMVHAAFASVARWAVVPVQDLLGQGSKARVNLPGSSDPANWTYRLVETAITTRLTTRIAELARTFDRVSRPESGRGPSLGESQSTSQ
jgi:4-alpha-glucanotransferase